MTQLRYYVAFLGRGQEYFCVFCSLFHFKNILIVFLTALSSCLAHTCEFMLARDMWSPAGEVVKFLVAPNLFLNLFDFWRLFRPTAPLICHCTPIMRLTDFQSRHSPSTESVWCLVFSWHAVPMEWDVSLTCPVLHLKEDRSQALELRGTLRPCGLAIS